LARKSKGDELVLVAGSKRQMRKASDRNWSKAKEGAFLSVLAETCNVTRAAAEAGVSLSGAYQRRKADAAFRGAWFEAIATAYQRLEMVLLERAFVGTEKLVRRRDGSEERMVEYPNQLALTLLKMHRDTAVETTAEVAPDDVEEIRERLLEKLERLRKREAESGVEA
jgi:hypothetical protein